MTAITCQRKKNKPTEATVNDLDEKGFAKYHAIVEEYKKRLENQQKVKPTAFKLIQLEDHVEQENEGSTLCKVSDAKQPLQTSKQHLPTNEAFTEVAGSQLRQICYQADGK